MAANVASMIQQFNMDNLRILLDLGFRVDVACNFEQGSTISLDAIQALRSRLDGMGIRCFQVDFSRNPIRFKAHVSSYCQMKDLLTQGDYAFIHTHGPISSAIVRLAASRKKVPVVYTAHGFHFYQGGPLSSWLLYYPVERLLARHTDTLITINGKDYYLAERLLRPGYLVRVFGVGIDTAKFHLPGFDKAAYRKTLGIAEGDFVLLSVGELSDRKNHRVILEAMRILNRPNLNYVIVGMGANEGMLKELAVQSGLQDRVFLLGYRQDIPELCNMSDAFAFPSIREGLGLACLEAMAAGLPAIASRSDGPVEYLADGQMGYLCNHDDAAAFAKAIATLMDTPGLAASLGQNAREAASRYDISSTNEIMRSVYSRFLSPDSRMKQA